MGRHDDIELIPDIRDNNVMELHPACWLQGILIGCGLLFLQKFRRMLPELKSKRKYGLEKQAIIRYGREEFETRRSKDARQKRKTERERSGSGGRIRTGDLRVMSPMSYQAAPPRTSEMSNYKEQGANVNR